jgi:hypothetical protein
MMTVSKINISKICNGIKSILNSLSITPDLSPGLLRVPDTQALALNLSLLLITETHNKLNI